MGNEKGTQIKSKGRDVTANKGFPTDLLRNTHFLIKVRDRKFRCKMLCAGSSAVSLLSGHFETPRMSGKQAKILSKDSCDDLLVFASTTQHPVRDRLIVLLSIKAGLRAAEIGNLTWETVLTPTGDISSA